MNKMKLCMNKYDQVNLSIKTIIQLKLLIVFSIGEWEKKFQSSFLWFNNDNMIENE